MQPVTRRGFTLLEVLIALLVFSLGLLGLAGLMVVSVKTNQSAFLDFMAEHAAEWWVAEDQESGRVVGYARSVERGGLFELAEFFVLPDNQSAGIGRALLDKAFPAGRGEVRAIIATTDVRAQARYYQAGTVARFPIVGMTAKPGAAAGATLNDGLEPVRATADDIGALSALGGLPFLFVPEINLLAFGISALIGVVFGYFPARRAAALNPIDALRHE